MIHYAIGEIAIYCNGDSHPEYNGQECTIDSRLSWRFPKSSVTGQRKRLYGYRTIAADGRLFSVRPDQIRKRHPPQDWARLCKLDEVKYEELAHV